MKRLLTLALIASVCAIAATDPVGWDKARWGMTESQLLRTFGGEVVRLDPPVQMGLSAAQETSLAKPKNDLRRLRGQPESDAEPYETTQITVRLAVQPITLAHATFRALLIPDQAGRLDSVLLTPIHTAGTTLFESLRQLLVQKYGRPWITKTENSAEAQWTVNTTVITLTRWRSDVTILYKRKPATRL